MVNPSIAGYSPLLHIELFGSVREGQASDFLLLFRCMQGDKSVCANEDEVCKCSGTVYYGPMSSKDGTSVTLDNLKNGQEPSKAKHAANGHLTCSNKEFGGKRKEANYFEGDPAEGRVKVCRCDVDGK